MKNNKAATFVSVVIFLIILLIMPPNIIGVGNGARYTCAATETEYTDVLDDLKKDPAFNPDLWNKGKDLKLVQVAEGVTGELFIYVAFDESLFAPAILGTVSMTMSTQVCNNVSDINGLKFVEYKLEIINSNQHFHKFKVKDFTVLKDKNRYYNISSLLRRYVSSLDDNNIVGGTINNVAFKVGELWSATESADGVKYEMTNTEVVTITEKYVDFLRYINGFWLVKGEACDSHYVAFSADYDIDELYEVDIEYKSQYFYYKGTIDPITNKKKVQENNSASEPEEEPLVTIKPSNVTNKTSGPFGKKHEWNRIQRSSDFIANEDLSDEAKTAVSKTQWVLRFTETSFIEAEIPPVQLISGSFTYEYTTISEVMLLRLNFASKGETYNLGVVDNKQTADLKPGNNSELPFGGGFDTLLKGGCNSKMSWTWAIVGLAVVVVLWIVIAIIKKPTNKVKIIQEKGNAEEKARQKRSKKKKRK